MGKKGADRRFFGHRVQVRRVSPADGRGTGSDAGQLALAVRAAVGENQFISQTLWAFARGRMPRRGWRRASKFAVGADIGKCAGSPWELPPRAPTDPDVPN
jgi:hypothetical protein